MSLPPPVPGRRVFGLSESPMNERVQIAVLVDLRAAHEADIDIAALQQQQHVGAAQHHVGALGAALLVGGGRQLARLDEGADHAALEQDGEAGAAQALRQRRRQQRDADAGEHDLPVLQLPRAQDRQQLAKRCGAWLSVIVDAPAPAARRNDFVHADQRRESRSRISARRRAARDTSCMPPPGPR